MANLSLVKTDKQPDLGLYFFIYSFEYQNLRKPNQQLSFVRKLNP